MIRILFPHEAIPYELLLLADETREAIDRYAHDAKIYVYTQQEALIGVYVLAQIDAVSMEISFEIHTIKKNFFIDHYPKPIYENGIKLNHMIMLKKDLHD